MRLTIGNLLMSGAKVKGERSATILARKPDDLNLPGCLTCFAAEEGYKVSGMTEARRRIRARSRYARSSQQGTSSPLLRRNNARLVAFRSAAKARTGTATRGARQAPSSS